MSTFDRAAEDVGNVVFLEHVNTRVPDQHLATLFYVTGLGLTRDPFLVTGTTNMWINVGRSQFHLPTGPAQIVRGKTGIVLPDRAALLARLHSVKEALADTRFSFSEQDDHVAVTCPWGNRICCHEPGGAFGDLQLGMPYVALDVPPGTTTAIASFYEQMLSTPGISGDADGVAMARVQVGIGQELRFIETDAPQAAFDGHHIAIYLANFSGPHGRLKQRGIVSEESNQHQYRFVDIVDPGDGRVLFELEHEVRSLRHPLYGREHVNRNPAITNNAYRPGYQELSSVLPS
jgi:hypothetical protein